MSATKEKLLYNPKTGEYEVTNNFDEYNEYLFVQSQKQEVAPELNIYSIRVDGAELNIHWQNHRFLTDNEAIDFARAKASEWDESETIEVRKQVAPRKWINVL